MTVFAMKMFQSFAISINTNCSFAYCDFKDNSKILIRF